MFIRLIDIDIHRRRRDDRVIVHYARGDGNRQARDLAVIAIGIGDHIVKGIRTAGIGVRRISIRAMAIDH